MKSYLFKIQDGGFLTWRKKVKEGLSAKVTFKQSMREQLATWATRGRVYQAEGKSNTEA